jgi:hypothetical protein
LEKLDRLTDFANSGEVDLVVFSGDFTAMGTRAEFATARAAIQPFVTSPAEFVCVAGNHDLYTRTVVRERRFEKTFEGLLETDLPDSRADGPWPIVRLLGDDVAVVALNSAKPNPVPWRSSGRVPQRQLEALHAILRRPEMEGRFVFIVTHYASGARTGERRRVSSGLRRRGAWCHPVRACTRDVPRAATRGRTRGILCRERDDARARGILDV